MRRKLSSSTGLGTTQPPESYKILVLGDGCTDEYIYGNCTRLNPEAPVPVMKYNRIDSRGGMAWNVFNNLNAFGLDVDITTNKELIYKTRYVDEKSNQQILRVDREDPVTPFTGEIDDKYDVIVISDYDKGFLSQAKLFDIVQCAECPVFIDSKKTELPKYNCIIKLNEPEYQKLKSDNHNVIVTRGSAGAEYAGQLFPAQKVKVYDVVGAGDTFLAALVYFYLRHGRIESAIPHANKAASIAVQNIGTYVLTEEDVNLLL